MSLVTEEIRYLKSRTVAPTAEPIHVSAAKRQCNIDLEETHLDEWFLSTAETSGGAIQAARELVETHSETCLMPQAYELRLSEWPCEDEIPLRVHPVYSATVTYYDTTNTSQTWSSSNYDVRQEKKRSVLVKAATSTDWPDVTTERPYPITFTLSCGVNATTYATAVLQRAQVPGAAKRAMLLLLGHWFKNRESVLVGTISKEIEQGYWSLINSIKPTRYP